MTTLVSRSERVSLVRFAQQQAKGRRALDALVAKLRRRVTDTAGRSPEVLGMLGGRRHRVLGAELHVEEPGKNLLHAIRHAEVSTYDYDRDVLVSTIVDLASGDVVRAVEHRGVPPPPTREEVDEAAALATAEQAALARRWRARQVIATAIPAREASIEGHACYGHRAITLYFWTRGPRGSRVGGPVLVDLSRQRVVPPEPEGAPGTAGMDAGKA